MTHHTLCALCCATTAAILLSACNLNQPPTSGSDEKLAGSPTQLLAHTASAMAEEQVLSVPADVRNPSLTKIALAANDAPMVISRNELTAQVPNSEHYESAKDNPTQQTDRQSVSTFSIDVDTGSYSNVRRFLELGSLPPTDAVRVEEMLNYFSYDYSNDATVEQPFSVITELGQTPWNSKTHLLHIGLKGYMPPQAQAMPANLVFLIDVSGSMDNPDKLGLLKSSISMLATELDATDTVSIVVYAGSSGVVLKPTPGDQHKRINKALSRLRAGGSTNGVAGIELAYELASEHYQQDGINRVILATDGDFNVGLSNTEQLKQLISEKRQSGIALTTLGFGTGNYNDHLMEQLADAGNGNYAYIDTLAEARKVLVDERHSTMMRIANDVKIQIEFNPERISEYRLIGYTNRLLANEDFSNDKVDAGDIGAGHTVTALYEVALRGQGGEKITPLRYKNDVQSDATTFSDELAEVRLRYKLPNETQSRLIRQTVRDSLMSENPSETSENFRFSASVAALGQLLRDNNRIEDFDYRDVRQLAQGALADDTYGYRSEFVRLVDLADSLDKIQRAASSTIPNDEG